MTTTNPETDVAAVQRHTTRVLMATVGAAGMGMAGGYSGTSLAAQDMTNSDGWATFAATMISVGGAIATVPLARYMANHGRRPGLAWGWTFAFAGAVLAFFAVVIEFYPLLVIGVLGIGVGNGTNLAARYTAADLALPERRARAIGILVWAASIGSVLGPTVALGPTGWVAEQMGLAELAGPYLLGMVVFSGAAVFVHLNLRPDPLLLARELEGEEARLAKRPSLVESFTKLFRHRPAALAVAAMAVGQAVMAAVMTVTPLHMNDGAHEKQIIGLVISLHIVGMYFFAPLVGWLVDRLPANVMVAAAGITLFFGGEVASHTDPEDSLGVFVGLFLVGLGWSFAMISGSALLTSAFPAHERASVQGAADFTMVAAGALASLASGVIVELFSFHALSHWAAIVSLSLVAAALYPVVIRTKPTPAPSPLRSSPRR